MVGEAARGREPLEDAFRRVDWHYVNPESYAVNAKLPEREFDETIHYTLVFWLAQAAVAGSLAIALAEIWLAKFATNSAFKYDALAEKSLHVMSS